MSSPQDNDAAAGDSISSGGTRLQLLGDILVFQLKLLVDGFRDLLLSPLSLAAGMLGLVMGGTAPARYFKRVIEFGRRSERWINLFGESQNISTADDLVDPVRARILDRAQANAWVSRVGRMVNSRLDGINQRAERTTDLDRHPDR